MCVPNTVTSLFLDSVTFGFYVRLLIFFISFRVIIDGPGSATVFNGPIQLVDSLYTKADTFMTGKDTNIITIVIVKILSF